MGVIILNSGKEVGLQSRLMYEIVSYASLGVEERFILDHLSEIYAQQWNCLDLRDLKKNEQLVFVKAIRAYLEGATLVDSGLNMDSTATLLREIIESLENQN